MGTEQEALAWQTGVWDRISDVYLREIDARFVPVVRACLDRADLRAGESVLDLGTGTGAVAVEAARRVEPGGSVLAVDLSPDMLELARGRAKQAEVEFEVREGRAEEIPADDGSMDVVLASLSLMYVIDRRRGAQELARVLRPGGRLVAAVWAGADDADIVRFQQTAGSFAPAPPVAGVGPGALADVTPFLEQLHEAGIDADVDHETTEFTFDSFDQAWEVLAGVTTASLDEGRREEARQAVREVMWPDPDEPRRFSNRTQLIIGTRG